MQDAVLVVAFPGNVRERWLQKPVAKLLSFEGSHPGQARLLLHLVGNVPQAHVETLLFAVKNSILGLSHLQGVFCRAGVMFAGSGLLS